MSDLVSGILTALGSGVAAALATYSMNSNKDHVFLLRQKAEDLHISFQKYSNIVSNYALHHMSLAKGSMSMDILYELIKSNSSDTDSGKKVVMLVNIYFPELKPLYEAFRTRLSSTTKLGTQIEKIAQDAGGTMQYNKRLFELANYEAEKLFEASHEFETAIAEAGRAVASQDALLPRAWSRLVAHVHRNRSIPLE